jgi:hypothetical protein
LEKERERDSSDLIIFGPAGMENRALRTSCIGIPMAALTVSTGFTDGRP